MLIRAPAFTKAGRVWKPFRFANLEKVSKRHALLVRNLEWMLPNVRSTGEVSSSVRKRLHEILDDNVSLHAEYVHVVPLSKLRHYVGEPTFLAVLSPQPNKTRGLLEVELGLAHMAIDMLLGGAGEAMALRPLTDIEEGVMTYVIIETLKALAPSLDPSLPKLRIEGLVRSFDEVQSLIGEDESLAVVQLKAIFGSHSGYVRIFIPEAVLATANPPEDAPIRRARRASEFEANGARLRNVKTTVRFELGQVEISSGDLSQLRERDVVLVDALTARPDLGQGGTLKARLGQGLRGRIDLDVAVTDGKFTATVTGFTLGAPPPPGALGPAEEAPPPLEVEESTSPGIRGRDSVEGNPEAADLMNDIPLQISIELARLPVSAEDVLTLKVGHVFDLQRTAGEPLDLSVNGRIVARGVLVEVDGNLGVRIISLAG
jgi:flagellar motor switch protein FliM